MSSWLPILLVGLLFTTLICPSTLNQFEGLVVILVVCEWVLRTSMTSFGPIIHFHGLNYTAYGIPGKGRGSSDILVVRWGPNLPLESPFIQLRTSYPLSRTIIHNLDLSVQMACLLRDVPWILIVNKCSLRKSSTHLGLQCLCIDSNSLQMMF